MTTTAEITALPAPAGGYPLITGINASGTVIGVETTANNNWEGFMVSNGAVTILSPTPSYVSAINNSGEIVGWSGSNYAAERWLYGVYPSNLLANGGDGIGNAVNSTGSIGGMGWYNGQSFVAFVSINSTVTWLGALNNLTPSGNTTSSVTGINDSNEAVGFSIYQSGSIKTHAFSWVSGVMTDLGTLAGDDNSQAVAINNAGQIIGFSNASSGNQHAVLWQNGAITQLGGLAGASDSQANGLNNKGQIVGFSDLPSSQHAVLWQNGAVTDLNTLLPANSGWVLNNAVAITDTGLITGFGTYKGNSTPFEMSLNGLTTPLHTAQAVISLFNSGLSSIPAQTVSDTGADVAANLDALQSMAAAGELTSIRLSDASSPTVTLSAAQLAKDAGALAKILGAYTLQIDITGASASDVNVTLTAPAGTTMVVSLNEPASHYSITETANNASVTVTDTRAGEATRDVFNGVSSLSFSDGSQLYFGPHGPVVVQALGTSPVTPQAAWSVDSNSGDITGYAGSNQSPTQDVAFLWHNGAIINLSPLAGGSGSQAYHIANGQIVGDSYASNPNGASSVATLWQAGSVEAGSLVPVSLGWLPGDFASIAYGVNDSGAVVGTSYSTSTAYRGFLWQNGQMTNLGSLGGSQVQPVAINDATQIVGSAALAGGASHAFLWQNGVMADLGVLTGGTTSRALAINSSGTIAGYSTDSSGLDQAVYWSNGQIHRLSNLLTNTSSSINGINDHGLMVGESGSSSGSLTAVLWANGGIYNLNAFLPSGSAWVLGDAYSINGAGQISGWGTHSGATASFEITLPSTLTFTSSSALSEFSNSQLYAAADLGDSAAHIAASLDSLETMAAAGDLGSITLTDSATPSLTVSTAQLTADAAVLNDISSAYNLTVLAGSSSANITGPAGHATTLSFTGTASQYTVTAANGVVTVAGNGVTDHLSNVAAIQFSDFTEIVAASPGSGSVTTGNVTELYSAVLAREPDIGGLTFYQTYLKANPNTPLVQFAQWFLTSSEYSSAHTYAQTTDGESQFITDSYQNLLHRTPLVSDINFYLTKVIQPALANLTPGTQAYAAADLQAHAQMLVYFSASSEFLSDVQITAANPVSSQHWLILT